MRNHLVFDQEEYEQPSSLRLKFRYRAEDFLFVNKLTIKADDQTREFKGQFDREVFRGDDIVEWGSILIDSKSDMEFVKRMAIADSLKFRLEGNRYYKDVAFKTTVQRALLAVLLSFKMKGGDL